MIWLRASSRRFGGSKGGPMVRGHFLAIVLAIIFVTESPAQPVRQVVAHDGVVGATAYRPDGAWLATGGAERVVRVWDPASGKIVHTLTGHGGPVTALAFSPDGATLASADADGRMLLWKPGQASSLRYTEGHSACTRAIAFHPDGRTIFTCGEDRRVRLW